jgi:hypothetical protein
MDEAFQAELPRVLARGTADGHRLDLVEDGAGHVSIMRDDLPLEGLNWRAVGVDACVRSYLRMLRHGPHVEA